MFFSRRILSVGLRMTFKHLQDVTGAQNIRNSTSLIQHNQFSSSIKLMTENNFQQPVQSNHNEEISKHELGKLEGKLQLSFTCKKCNTRNSNKIISKIAYNKGVVIVRCDGCKNNHLIADNLGWFGSINEIRNIEIILKKKGENIRRIRDDTNGYFEAIANEEVLKTKESMKLQDLNYNEQSIEEAKKKIEQKKC